MLQMCRGLSPKEKAQFGIQEGDRGVAAFAYLANSGCISIPGIDDAKDFQDVKTAMATVGIDAAGQAQIWQLLSGVLQALSRVLAEKPLRACLSNGADECHVIAKLTKVRSH